MTMPLLLGTDPVTLYAPGGDDPHGWALPGAEAAWAGTGNLQLDPGPSDSEAAGGGGHGPHDPARGLAGTLYLPPAAAPAEGMTALVGELPFVLSQVRSVADPTLPRGEGISCWVATVTGTGRWDGDGG